MDLYLFRGINKKEKEAGCILIPKSQNAFKVLPRFPFTFPVNLGERVEHAIREHQNKRELGVETAGVSTSVHFEVAKKYAREKIVVKIDRSKLKAFDIREYIVKEEGYQPINLEEDEVILVNETLKVFPKEIVAEVINLET